MQIYVHATGWVERSTMFLLCLCGLARRHLKSTGVWESAEVRQVVHWFSNCKWFGLVGSFKRSFARKG